MPKDTAIVYWLMPAKSERELFRQLIRILAKEFDAPHFEPHLTLFATRKAQRLLHRRFVCGFGEQRSQENLRKLFSCGLNRISRSKS